MFNSWFYLLLVCALTDWYAVSSDRYQVRYLTKPLTLALLIAWFTTSGGWQTAGGLFFGLGLIFSLLGDIFLLKGVLLRYPGFFQLGLLSFLVTQALYTTAFVRTTSLLSGQALLAVLPVAAIGYFNAGRIIRCLNCTPEGSKQIIPISVYMLTLSLMLVSALSTLVNPAWPPAAALLAAVGAGLFYTSDSILGHDCFVEPIRTGQTLLTVIYHLGQIAIIAGFLFRVV